MYASSSPMFLRSSMSRKISQPGRNCCSSFLMTATASYKGRKARPGLCFSTHAKQWGGRENLPRAPDVAEEEVPLLAVGEGDAVAHRLALRGNEPHGLHPRGADRRYEDDGQRDGEHGGGEDDDKGGGAARGLVADKGVAHAFVRGALAQLRRRGGQVVRLRGRGREGQ